MKIYTKTGDKGTTALFGGKRLPKHDIRIEAYGTVDELNSSLGWLRDQGLTEKQTSEIIEIQNNLFVIGSHLATDPEKKNLKLPPLSEDAVSFLEKSMDAMDDELPEMRHFVLPGGHPAVSACHMSRCICRRAERWVSHVHETSPVNPIILIYLNRLSDWLFVLSRKIAQEKQAREIPWIPNMGL